MLDEWERIKAGKTEKWPMPTDDVYKYSFALLHNLHPIENSEFEWVDYPGSALTSYNASGLQKIQANIESASCLLLMINGASFAQDFSIVKEEELAPLIETSDKAVYKEKVAANLVANNDRLAITTLSQMAQRGVKFPPIAVVVTKRDKIDRKWRGCIGEIIHENFRLLLDHGVPVFVTSVTLGEDVERGGILLPEDVEKPIAYALLSNFYRNIKAAKERISDNQDELNKEDTFWNRMFNSEMLDSLKARINSDQTSIAKMSGNARPLLNFFDDSSIFYVEGKQTNLSKYFSALLN